MEVFRISKEKHANADLKASGAANRWNVEGQYVIYTGWTRSLSTLELVVHRNSIAIDQSYKVMVISIADEDHLYSTVKLKQLPENWRSINAYTQLQQIGSEWYENRKSLVLKVPSAIITNEHNYVINTKHEDFTTKVKFVRTEHFFWDKRLF